MTRTVTSFLVISVLMTGCKKGWDVADIDDGPVAGMISGADWAAVSVEVQKDAFGGSDLSVTIYGEDVEVCGFGFSDSDVPFVLFSVEPTVGTMELSLSLSGGQTITLVEPPANNLIATEGVIDVTAASDTELEMGLIAYIDDENQINGRFTATICAEE